MSADTCDKLNALVAELDAMYELRWYATAAAAKELVRNWNDALSDGSGMVLRDMVVADVDLVIKLLGKFKEDALALADQPSPAPVR